MTLYAIFLFVLIIPILLLTARDRTAHFGGSTAKPSLRSVPFGEVDGKPVRQFIFSNANGIEVRATNYGGIITHIRVPNADGKVDDVVLGYDSLDGYLERSPYFGCIIGRYGNRIEGAEFTLDGVTYKLAAINGPNHVHGGEKGFDKVVWDAEPFDKEGRRGIVLDYTSQAGEEGYPGTLETRVSFILTDDDELIIDYHATTDAATPVNLTHHSYFNLAGVGKGDVLDHQIMINADRFTPVGPLRIPTGELRPVKDTPFDFTETMAIGDRIDARNEQIEYGDGYNHNFVLNGEVGEMKLAARVFEPTSGRLMEVRTTEPGLQFYTGNFLDGSITGKGTTYPRRSGFCLETQHFPNSPNQENFPSTILRPDEEYETRTIYAFSVR